MKINKENREESGATTYVKSLKDAVKKRFATEYLAWITAGRSGPAPSRGFLPPALWKAVVANLDALA